MFHAQRKRSRVERPQGIRPNKSNEKPAIGCEEQEGARAKEQSREEASKRSRHTKPACVPVALLLLLLSTCLLLDRLCANVLMCAVSRQEAEAHHKQPKAMREERGGTERARAPSHRGWIEAGGG